MHRAPHRRLFVQVDNLFDRRYANASYRNATWVGAACNFIPWPFAAAGDYATLVGSTFYAPGAPLTTRARGACYAFGQ